MRLVRQYPRYLSVTIDWERLEADIRELALSEEAVPGEASEYGRKYEVRGTATGPVGQEAQVVTVWIVLAGDDLPRFVTAYPGM